MAKKILRRSRRTPRARLVRSRSSTRRIRRVPRTRVVGRRRYRRVNRWKYSKVNGVVKKKFVFTFPIYPCMTTVETDVGNPYHMDSALVFKKGGVQTSYDTGAWSDNAAPPTFYQTDPSADTYVLATTFMSEYMNDFLSVATRYKHWKPGGFKINYTPQGNASGVAYCLNKNDVHMGDTSATVNTFYDKSTTINAGTCHEMNQVFDWTIGTNLDKCTKYPAALPFRHYFKRKVPASEVLPHGGWIPCPDKSKKIVSIDPTVDEIMYNLHSGLGFVYFQMDDKYFHSVSKDARNLMVENSRYSPIGMIKLTQYIYYKKFDKQFSTSTAKIKRPDGTSPFDYQKDHLLVMTDV